MPRPPKIKKQPAVNIRHMLHRMHTPKGPAHKRHCLKTPQCFQKRQHKQDINSPPAKKIQVLSTIKTLIKSDIQKKHQKNKLIRKMNNILLQIIQRKHHLTYQKQKNNKRQIRNIISENMTDLINP